MPLRSGQALTMIVERCMYEQIHANSLNIDPATPLRVAYAFVLCRSLLKAGGGIF